MKKRIISLLITTLMIMSVITIPSYAEAEDKIYGNYLFNESTLPKGLSLRNSYDCVDIENSVLKLWYKPTLTASAAYLNIDTVTAGAGELPELVVEYRSRMVGNAANSYMSDNSTKLITYYTKNYFGDINNVGWELKSGANFDVIDDVTQWHTYAVKYSNKDDTRSLYIDGQLIGTTEDAAGNNPWFTNKKASFTFKLYDSQKKSSAEFEYIKVWSPTGEVKVEASSESYELNKINLKFSSNIVNITPEMIDVDGITADAVTLIDVDEQIYEVVLPEDLTSSTNYTVNIDGAVDALGRVVTEQVDFTTRDKTFYITDFKVTDGDDEITAVTSGNLVIECSAVNELTTPGLGTVIAAQYDAEGYLDKENYFAKDISVETTLPLEENITVEPETSDLSAFVWKDGETPVPISDVKTYGESESSEMNLTFGLPTLETTPSVEASVKDDYSGLTVTVDTNDTDYERIVGLLVKFGDETEYVANAKTENGEVTFDVPLKEEQIGSYSIIAGVENGGTVKLSPDIDFYSTAYIDRMIEEKINSEEADSVSVGEFTDKLGSYLGFDMARLNKLTDKTYAYGKLLDLRDAEEGGVISSQERLTQLFATAVKMACIYEGIDTADIISESTDMAVDDTTKNTFSTVISEDAQDYVADKLKGVKYDLPSDMTEDIKTYTILGGVYKADHYTVAGKIIEIYGDELGIDAETYGELDEPEEAANKIIGNEYTDLEVFADAVNDAIANQKEAEEEEEESSNKSSGGSKGGGGGYSVSYPTTGGNTQTGTNTGTQTPSQPQEQKPSAKSYIDVVSGHWFYNDVMWATEQGYFIGTSETTFSPDTYLSWEQIAIVLSRIGFSYQTDRGGEAILRGDFANLLYSFMADKSKYGNVDEWIEGTKMFIGNDSGNMMFDEPLTRAQCCTLIRRIENR